jgi:type VI secretion system protein ImpF
MATLSSDKGLVASVLDRLLDDDPRAGTPFVDRDDIKKPRLLIEKLLLRSDALSAFIAEQLLPETQGMLGQIKKGQEVSDDLLHILVVALNQVICMGCIYDTERFKAVRLPKDVMRLLEDTPRGINVPYLNRMLLDEAYVDEIHRLKKVQSTYSVRQLKDDVARDLASLLNSRQELQQGVPEEFKELRGSLLELGVPDFTAYSLSSSEDRKRIRREVEQAIAESEPRLKSVRVHLEPEEKFSQVLRFRIEGLLRVESLTEPVTFDAALYVTNHQYDVRGV